MGNGNRARDTTVLSRENLGCAAQEKAETKVSQANTKVFNKAVCFLMSGKQTAFCCFG